MAAGRDGIGQVGRRLGALAVAFGVVALGGFGAPVAEAAVVNCYDPARDIVQAKQAHACDGDVVSDARARSIRSERQRRHIRVLQPDDDAPGADRGPRTQVGSGFAVGDGRTVATARHVVTDCAAITVATTAGAEASAEILAKATMADLALLRIDGRLVPPLPLARGRADVPPGTPVVAMGYPEQGMRRIRPATVRGEVIKTMRPDAGPPVIVFRAGVRRGNSGGPLLRNDGRVLGLVVAKVNTPSVFRETGDTVRDVAFAYPVSALRDLLPDQPVEAWLADDATLSLDMAEARTLRVICQRGGA